MWQEHRHRLLDVELRCCQVGEVATRSTHLYYSQYQRTSDTALLSKAFVFYHAVLDRAYFVADADHLAPTKHLRFLTRFLLVALLLARHADTVPRLAPHIRPLNESEKTLQLLPYWYNSTRFNCVDSCCVLQQLIADQSKDLMVPGMMQSGCLPFYFAKLFV